MKSQSDDWVRWTDSGVQRVVTICDTSTCGREVRISAAGVGDHLPWRGVWRPPLATRALFPEANADSNRSLGTRTCEQGQLS